MSSIKINEKMNIDDVLTRLKKELHVSKDNKLSELLGLSPQGFINKRNKGTLLAHIFQYAIKKKMNLHWLFYGEILDDKLREVEPEPGYDDQRLKIYDLLKKAGNVLESKGIYSTALASNINAFHQSILAEHNYGEMKTRMEALEEKDKKTEKLLAELARQIQILQEENRVLKLGGSFGEDPEPEEGGGEESETLDPTQPSSRKTM